MARLSVYPKNLKQNKKKMGFRTFTEMCIEMCMVYSQTFGHSLPSADSRRAIVSFWRKNVHNTG